jgi:hypothetical protein
MIPPLACLFALPATDAQGRIHQAANRFASILPHLCRNRTRFQQSTRGQAGKARLEKATAIYAPSFGRDNPFNKPGGLVEI